MRLSYESVPMVGGHNSFAFASLFTAEMYSSNSGSRPRPGRFTTAPGVWRHFAYSELKEPGTYFPLLATAEHTLGTGKAPAGSVSAEDIKALIDQRLGW